MPRKKEIDSTGAVTKKKRERLSDQEKTYCHLYVHNFSQLKSYMEAYGVDRATAVRIAYRKHKKKAVQEEIQRLLDEKLKDIDLRPGSVIQQHIDIAFADINDYVYLDENGELRLKDFKDANGTVVSEMQYSPQSGAFRVRLNDRQKSLDWLASNLYKAEDDKETGVVVLADVE